MNKNSNIVMNGKENLWKRIWHGLLKRYQWHALWKIVGYLQKCEKTNQNKKQQQQKNAVLHGFKKFFKKRKSAGYV